MKFRDAFKKTTRGSTSLTGSEQSSVENCCSYFSLNSKILKDILDHAKPLGHNEKPRNHNLGFGFIYYGVVRALRPKHTLVIGSGYGFSVVCLALGIKDNGIGRLSFVDPSYSLIKDGPGKTVGGCGFWNDSDAVHEHFKKFSVDNVVTYFKLRSDQLFSDYEKLQLPPIDLAFVDGSHSYESVRYDFTEVVRKSHKNTYVFLHDTNIYVREIMQHAGVKRWFNVLKKQDKAFEVINFPFSSGVALVRIVDSSIWKQLD
jgi:predicted O-methyltransferase YrrM